MRASLAVSIAFISWLSWSPILVTAQGNTTCKTTSLDWYTNSVGETPCQTYQQLRQICNSAYAVGSLSTSTPPDTCDDQVADCCCNSVAFALSMLCLNCQQGVGSGVGGDTGYDAGAGAYQIYLTNCPSKAPNTNQSLPVDIQAAVCNDKIKIDDDLYTLFWVNGAWFYMYTREFMQKNQQAYANNTYTHCASTTISNNTLSLSSVSSTRSASSSSGTSSTSGTSSASPSNQIYSAGSRASPMSKGTIIGIAIGAVLAILIIGFFVLYLRKQRRKRNISGNLSIVADHRNMEEAVLQVDPFLTPANSAGVRTKPNNSQFSEISETRYHDDSQIDLPSQSNQAPDIAPQSVASISQLAPESEHHVDAGPLFARSSFLGRSPSGRLPPAYGQQL